MTTIHDLARQLNISSATVSKALNGYTDVSPVTRELVQDAARKAGYQPNAAARNLRRGRTEKFGLFMNTGLDYVVDYLSGIVAGTVQQCQQYGKNLLIYTITDNNPAQLLQVCRAGEIDGVILFSTHYNDNTIETLLKDKFPFVVMGREIRDERVSCVFPDFYTGSYDAMNYLIQQGHQRIGLMTRPELTTANEARIRAYKDVLRAAAINIDDDLIVETRIQPGSGIHPTEQLLALDNPPTAIFAFHDLVGVDVMTVLHRKGYRVPQDMSVMGFDGLKAGLMTSPRLSTVQQPLEYIGRRVIEIIQQQIDDPETPVIKERVNVEMVIRESTGKIL